MARFCLIVPTHNRPKLLNQALDYYSQTKGDFDFGIIIPDSSSDKEKRENKGVIAKYFSMLEILHLDSFVSESTLYDKIAGSLEYVNEKYVGCCADDDLIFLRGAEETANFLEENKDYAVAKGRYLSFHVRGRDTNNLKFYWQPLYRNHSLSFERPTERLADHFLDFNPTLYAVHRTDVLKKSFEGVMNSGVDVLLFGELLSSMLAVIVGKVKALDTLFIIRQEGLLYEEPSVKWPTLRDFLNHGTYDREYAKFKATLVKELVVSGENQEVSEGLIDESMAGYVKMLLAPNYRNEFLANLRDILTKSQMPRWFYRAAKSIYRSFVPVRRGGSKEDLSGTYLEKYNDEFKIMRDIVMKHAKQISLNNKI